MVVFERAARGLAADGRTLVGPLGPGAGVMVAGTAAPALRIPVPALAADEAFFAPIGAATVAKGTEVVVKDADVFLGGYALVAVADGAVVPVCARRADADAKLAELLGTAPDAAAVTLPMRSRTFERSRIC